MLLDVFCWGYCGIVSNLVTLKRLSCTYIVAMRVVSVSSTCSSYWLDFAWVEPSYGLCGKIEYAWRQRCLPGESKRLVFAFLMISVCLSIP